MPRAQGHRDALRELFAGAHRATPERPQLRPVPSDRQA